MGTIKNFEDLQIWISARNLVNLVYTDFNSCNDYVFRSQICRAALSVMNNIAEGFCRYSDAEFAYFLNISKGSSGEVKSMYYLGEDLHYVITETALIRRQLCQELNNGIAAFRKYLKSSD